MKPLFPALLLGLLAGPALADDIFCEQPWFIRNLIFDRAGYCFGSPLGQAVFDNSDCTGTEITLTERDREGVAHIRALEEVSLCAIDTDATVLEHLAHFEHLRAADLIPIPVEHESGCNGYLGVARPLHSQPGAAGRLTGQVVPGAAILFNYLSEDGWDYVITGPGDWGEGPRQYGWVYFGPEGPVCRQYAG